MSLNRVLEVDCDTDRDPVILVRCCKSTPHRQGIIPHEPDVVKDLIVLRGALLGAILHAEKSGALKPGEGMKKAIEGLQEGYIDITVDTKGSTFDENGNHIKP